MVDIIWNGRSKMYIVVHISFGRRIKRKVERIHRYILLKWNSSLFLRLHPFFPFGWYFAILFIFFFFFTWLSVCVYTIRTSCSFILWKCIHRKIFCFHIFYFITFRSRRFNWNNFKIKMICTYLKWRRKT